ncbi:MAG: DUF2461 domain-containing protein [Bacteroidales bacterium]|nr:DUF2461 domain-containing protein [Bacteroidales bacterium]
MDFGNILSFLEKLSENNNREWFNEHKAEYTQLKNEFENFIQQLIPKVNEIDPSIGLLEAKDCVFRIYRDVRFSKNKAPYKNHFGAYISNSGRKSKFAGYYLHIQPGESFIAAGAYSPEPEILKEIRFEILDNLKSFKSIIDTNEFKKYFNGIIGESLKTAPKGFPKDFEGLELIKFKSFEVIHSLENKALQLPDNEEYILKVMGIAQPYNNFFNKVIAHTINEE